MMYRFLQLYFSLLLVVLSLLDPSCSFVAGWMIVPTTTTQQQQQQSTRPSPRRPRKTPLAFPRFSSIVPDSVTTDSTLEINATAATNTNENDNEGEEQYSAFSLLLDNIASCLTASDLKRDRGTDGAATGWTAWIDERSAYRLQSCINALRLVGSSDNTNDTTKNNNDVALFWTRWFKATPAPLVIDVSPQVRSILIQTMAAALFESIDTTAQEFTSRIFVRLVVLPSGASLPQPLAAPTGAMVYGKLLYGGVTRFRLIGGTGQQQQQQPRRAGERQLICPADGTATRGWLQYGGSPRNYVAVDMGPCALLEVELLPKGPELAMMGCCGDPTTMVDGIMAAAAGNVLSLDDLLEFAPTTDAKDDSKNGNDATENDSWPDVCDLEDYFCTSTGGLRRQIDEIVRRVLDGRVVQPADDTQSSPSTEMDRIRREEMQGLLELGLHPPKGLLLYGPPGCGAYTWTRVLPVWEKCGTKDRFDIL